MSHAEQLKELREHVATLPAADQLEINMWESELADLLEEGGSNAFTAFAMTSARLAILAEQKA